MDSSLKKFIKPTATNSLFLNGKSHHPINVFKGIVLGESKRMRRLNEYDDDYYESLKILKKKCLRSGFDEKLVDGMIAKTKKWNREGKQIEEEEEKKERCKKLTWATEFPNI